MRASSATNTNRLTLTLSDEANLRGASLLGRLPVGYRSALWFFLLLAASSAGADRRSTRRPGPSVLPCTGITLSASYLAEAEPGKGPGFLFRVDNHTERDIRLAEPVPSSAHWYAHVGARWLWRASAGRGGALVDALQPRGRMFADQPATPTERIEYLTVPARGSQQWVEAMLNNPAIAYQPSCPQCNYPGENDYQAVFAYAYLPNAADDVPDLLRCGLRSEPVPMPPHAAGH